jgi:hypothetical protein
LIFIFVLASRGEAPGRFQASRELGHESVARGVATVLGKSQRQVRYLLKTNQLAATNEGDPLLRTRRMSVAG